MGISNRAEINMAGKGAGPNWEVQLSYGDDGTSVIANQRFDVEGYPYIRIHNTSGSAAVPSVSYSKSEDPVALADRDGNAVSVANNTSQLVEVRGAKVCSVNQACVVQLVA